MKKLPVLGLAVFFVFLVLSCDKDQTEESPKIKVCSFNIRFDNPNDAYNQWTNRRLNVVTFLSVEQPELIGFQEVLKSQLEYIEARLNNYTRIGSGRIDGDTPGEYSPIFFKTDRFTLADSGTFWLSETPEVPSMGWDAQLNRICTWVMLTDNETGESLHLYNTHFSHAGPEARLQSAELILDSIAAKSAGVHVVLTGDFNTTPGSDPYNKIVESGLMDAYDSKIKLGPEGTLNGFRVTGTFDHRIDYIFSRGFHLEYYICNSILLDNQYLSDHFPIIALLAYEIFD